MSAPLPPTPPHRLRRSRIARVALRVLAVLSLGLAVIGAILPGLPSTEFVLLAAWAAAQSSPRLHAWLVNHRWFGPPLRDWRDGRRVSRGRKLAATASMGVCTVILLVRHPGAWHSWLAIACMAAVLAWLWSRPLPRTAARHD